MKKNITIKILIILIILAISLISFVGIFIKNNNIQENIIPEYRLSKDLKGSRTVKLVVDSSSNQIILDSEGNISENGLDEEGNLKEGYSKKEEFVNKTEVLTEDNYKLCKKIIEKRLSAYGINDYTVRLNSENGEIVLELDETANIDTAIYNLEYTGEFTIKDSETKEILINSEDVKNAKAIYGTTESGTTVYLSIEFNKEGRKKLQEISRNYIEITDENGNKTTKKVTINLDDDQLIETYFEEENLSGELQLSIGSVTTDSATIKKYIENASRNSRINRFRKNAN